MKAKIIKATKGTEWYSDKIGLIVEVEETTEHPELYLTDYYQEDDPVPIYYYVKKDDVEIIEE